MTILSGKTILVTGASRGIGAAIDKHCVSMGAKVIPHANLPSENADARFLYEDLSLPGAGGRLFKNASIQGPIDAVVNNAGGYLPTSLEGEDWDDGWSRTMAVNVQAPADICRAAFQHYRKSGGGRIVNIASRAGHRGDGVNHAAYAASKAAILAMTKTWARGLSGENIHIYAIAPGWVETRMAPQDIGFRKKAMADIPLGRFAQPDEVAKLTAFLLSDACPSAVGATFDVNGASYVR
jgi:NAD(P)-dependent dehydrogenase (short-subunit alcohol dehydrogenase family)